MGATLTWQRGLHHGHVGLAAGAGEGGGDEPLLTLRAGDAHDEHVLGQPALVVRDAVGDAQREAFLAEQRVAAVAAAERHDAAAVGQVRHQDARRVARPVVCELTCVETPRVVIS